MIKYFKRRRKHSYNDLWTMVYGDGWYVKGLARELTFMQDIAGAWKISYNLQLKENVRLREQVANFSGNQEEH
jgi:hypothetical protein